jgi:AraC-like DNA-binding protein
MPGRVLLQTPSLIVSDYVCTAGPHDAPFTEVHAGSSISFVRRGSFGYRAGSRSHELVAGSVLIGRAGDEYTCSHDHHAGGDECLSIQLSAELIAQLGGKPGRIASGSVAPLPELMVLGELAQATADGATELSIEEAALTLCARALALTQGKPMAALEANARDRKRAVDAALWIESSSREEITLEAIAAQAGLSPFHFLRLFSAVIGVSPHQYLVRARLREAARLLCDADRPITNIAYDVGFGDLSNFVRSFGRAAGVSPRAYRKASAGDRKILQERIGRGS